MPELLRILGIFLVMMSASISFKAGHLYLGSRRRHDDRTIWGREVRSREIVSIRPKLFFKVCNCSDTVTAKDITWVVVVHEQMTGTRRIETTIAQFVMDEIDAPYMVRGFGP